jgi:hypothetical protein
VQSHSLADTPRPTPTTTTHDHDHDHDKDPDMAQLPTFPSIDFSGLDASKLAGLDGKVVAVARDAAYITIGFGVLGFQQAQVRRRELLKSLDGRVGASKTQMDDLRSTIETRITKLDERFTALDAKIDTAVDKLEQRLPEQAATIVGQAHDFAKSARKQMRGFIRSAA